MRCGTAALARVLVPAAQRSILPTVNVLKTSAVRCAAASSCQTTAPFPPSLRGMASSGGFHGQTPSVHEKVVHVTFSTGTGEMLRVAALEGQSLYEVAVKHGVYIGDNYTSHIVLSPDSYAAHEAPTLEEVEELDRLVDRAPTSRLASFLKLDAKVPETLCGIGEYRDVLVP
jgi:hypothetical protein